MISIDSKTFDCMNKAMENPGKSVSGMYLYDEKYTMKYNTNHGTMTLTFAGTPFASVNLSVCKNDMEKFYLIDKVLYAAHEVMSK